MISSSIRVRRRPVALDGDDDEGGGGLGGDRPAVIPLAEEVLVLTVETPASEETPSRLIMAPACACVHIYHNR
jgi:hypothetical protein